MKKLIVAVIAISAISVSFFANYSSLSKPASKEYANHFIEVTVCPVVTGATVTLSGNGIFRQATTNEKGKCRFSDNPGLPAGNYGLGVSAPGYSPGCLNPYYFSNTQDQYVSVCFGYLCGD
mgnify:CR=1 FL=1